MSFAYRFGVFRTREVINELSYRTGIRSRTFKPNLNFIVVPSRRRWEPCLD